MTHAELVERAARWLGSSMRCGVVLTEFVTHSGEIPDAIGWSYGAQWSVLVECKTSRADFLTDKHKPHRNPLLKSMGQEKWYFAEAGIINPLELPEGWGLAEVKGTKVYKTVPACTKKVIDFEVCAKEAHLFYSALWKIQHNKGVRRLHRKLLLIEDDVPEETTPL